MQGRARSTAAGIERVSPSVTSVAKRHSVIVLAGLALAGSVASAGGPNVDGGSAAVTAQLVGGVIDRWYLDINFIASATSGMTIKPPGLDPIALGTCDAVPTEFAFFFLFEEFADLEALLEAFPPGDYVVTVEDDPATATLTLETDSINHGNKHFYDIEIKSAVIDAATEQDEDHLWLYF